MSTAEGGGGPSNPGDPRPNPPQDAETRGITRSEHAGLRSLQGRPIGEVVNDVQRAGKRDVFVQPDDGRFVARGPRGREHIIEANGEHVTSVRRPDAAHLGRLRDGTIRPATEEEFHRLKDLAQ